MLFVIANMDVITLFRTYPEFQTILFEWLMQAYHKQWALKSARYQMAAKERYLFFLKEYAGLEDVVSDRFFSFIFRYVAGDAEPTEAVPAGGKARLKQRKEGIFHIFLKGRMCEYKKRRGEGGEMQRERRLFEIEKRSFSKERKNKERLKEK